MYMKATSLTTRPPIGFSLLPAKKAHSESAFFVVEVRFLLEYVIRLHSKLWRCVSDACCLDALFISICLLGAAAVGPYSEAL